MWFRHQGVSREGKHLIWYRKFPVGWKETPQRRGIFHSLHGGVPRTWHRRYLESSNSRSVHSAQVNRQPRLALKISGKRPVLARAFPEASRQRPVTLLVTWTEPELPHTMLEETLPSHIITR